MGFYIFYGMFYHLVISYITMVTMEKTPSLMGNSTINDYFTGWKPMSQQNDPKPMAVLLTGWKPMYQDGTIQMNPT